MKATYEVSLELDRVSGQWMADVVGLSVHTWGRTLSKAKAHALEALACHLDVEPSQLDGRLVFRGPELPSRVARALARADTARASAQDTANRAAEARVAAAQALVGEAHLSLRDAAEILGISHQRVQQLVNGKSSGS